MTAVTSVESRRPPRNALAGGAGLRGRLLARLQLVADLQVASVSRDVKAWLALRQGSILEVGCGDQPYLGAIPARCTYAGIDHASMRSEFAMRSRPSVQHYAGETFPVANGAFDSLFHTEVLEHVFDTRIFLEECRRVLKTGGEMFLTVPFQARYHFIPHDYFRFTPAALQALLMQAGFGSVQVAPRGNDIVVAAYKAAAVGFRWAHGGWAGKALFLATAPLTLLALGLAHAAMAMKVGSTDDCLGYSVTARAV